MMCRAGELAALGTSPTGTLFDVMGLNFKGIGEIANVAIGNYAGPSTVIVVHVWAALFASSTRRDGAV